MKLISAILSPALLFAALCGTAYAQSAQDLPPAAPATHPGETAEQGGQRLIQEAIAALGGPAWLNRTTEYREGQVAAFFRNQPTGAVTRFMEWTQLPTATTPQLSRTEYLTIKGMIKPGMKRDVAHVWTADNGYELTFKGRSELPREQVEDFLRRRAHSLDAVLRFWIHQPGVVVVAEGIGTRDRLPVDKVSVLLPSNDTVELELDQNTHLPVERAFEWRNEKFKDHDVDEEVYGDWRKIDGIATPMNITRYRNGDMVSQTFYTKEVRYNQPMDAALFNPDAPFLKK